MPKKSNWVETEVERGDRLFLLPVRCRLESKGNLVRTVVQRRDAAKKTWHTSLSSPWLQVDGAGLVMRDELDNLAQRTADTLIVELEAGPMHDDWEIDKGRALRLQAAAEDQVAEFEREFYLPF
tara:strand:+ start:755 stop:1126 length:372 start_codon:yes stop_codon:yes gene_type:complete